MTILDKEAVRDLGLVLANEREFYNFSMCLRINYEKKHRKEIFEVTQGIEQLAQTIKRYCQTEKVSSYYNSCLDLSVLRQTAHEMLNSWAGEWCLGNYHYESLSIGEVKRLVKQNNKDFFSRSSMAHFNSSMAMTTFDVRNREVICIHRDIDRVSGQEKSRHLSVYSIDWLKDFDLNFKERRTA